MGIIIKRACHRRSCPRLLSSTLYELWSPPKNKYSSFSHNLFQRYTHHRNVNWGDVPIYFLVVHMFVLGYCPICQVKLFLYLLGFAPVILLHAQTCASPFKFSTIHYSLLEYTVFWKSSSSLKMQKILINFNKESTDSVKFPQICCSLIL